MCRFGIPSSKLLCIEVLYGTSFAKETINRVKNNKAIISFIAINKYIPEFKFQMNVQLRNSMCKI